MSREVQQNILTTAPDGSVGAVFPGGVQLPVNSPIVPVPTNAVEWVEASTGAVRGLLFAGRAGVSVPPTGLYQTRVRAQGTGLLRFSDLICEVNDADGSTSVSALVGGGGDSAVILNSAGSSGFLRLKTTANLQLQIFEVAVNGVPAGTQTINFNLPSAWTNNHFFLLASMRDISANGTGITTQFGTAGLSQGIVRIWGNTSTQNFVFPVMSFGN